MDDGASTVISTLNSIGLSHMQDHFYTNGRPIFSIVSSDYIPLIVYLDKDGNISNLSYQISNQEILNIISNIEGTTSK